MVLIRSRAFGVQRGALAALLVSGALSAQACGGPAFSNNPEGASGGQESSGGITSGGAETGGRTARTGGTASSEGGNESSGGTNSGGSEAGGDSGGSSSGETSSGGKAASGGRFGTGGGRSGGAPSTGGTLGAGGKAAGGVTSGGKTASSGGDSTGGLASGGTLGGGAGGAATGGLSVGGISVGGGLIGTGGAANMSFPSTSLLDDFNAQSGVLKASWVGATDDFALENQQLIDTASIGNPLLWDTEFGPNQEVYATLTSFHESTREINLILKAQELGEDCELIEVMYHPDREEIGVDICVNGSWSSLPVYAVTLVAGDQLGARISAAGKINVYRNGALLTTFNASAFPKQNRGRIGVNSAGDAEHPAMWDDFGGGNFTP